jgi:two-component sensor histidine kinase
MLSPEAIVRSQLEYRGIGLTLVEHSFPLSSVKCWMLGMILAELVFNSVRHAFQGRKTEGGEIHVEVQLRGPAHALDTAVLNERVDPRRIPTDLPRPPPCENPVQTR